MRRKPSSQNNSYNNQHKKPRYQGGGSQGGGHHHNHNSGRPRKNYSASREKYLAQARDALASGDRVLAENYFQHADHCYRMMVEEGYYARNNQPAPAEAATVPAQEEIPVENNSALPAFLTATYEPSEQEKPAEPVIVQHWEERDAEA